MQNPLASLTYRERFGLAVAAGVLTLFGIGSSVYRSRATPLEPTVVPLASPRPSPPTPAPSLSPSPKPAPPVELVVYVSGAVKRPGVYSFRSGQRLYQAIQRAGGFKSGAQQDALNLADHLKDAQQVHVPTHQAPTLPALRALTPRAANTGQGPAGSSSAAPAPGKLHSPSEGVVRLNQATQEELERLPGVGPSTAQSILEYRKTSNGFKELDELKEVRGIGEKKFEKMRPFLTL